MLLLSVSNLTLERVMRALSLGGRGRGKLLRSLGGLEQRELKRWREELKSWREEQRSWIERE